ncbi:putative endonuclease [Pseudomonas phage BroderSalsa]|nr:putative endonuclease [Pseudomonas phage BroderSalsa]
MHWLKVRKDGTKQTMAEWATKNGFKYYSEEEFVESFQ